MNALVRKTLLKYLPDRKLIERAYAFLRRKMPKIRPCQSKKEDTRRYSSKEKHYDRETKLNHLVSAPKTVKHGTKKQIKRISKSPNQKTRFRSTKVIRIEPTKWSTKRITS